MPDNSSQNTSGNDQVSIKVSPGGSICERQARDLERQIRAEISRGVSSPGGIGVLSTDAISQLIQQVRRNPEFIQALSSDIIASQALDLRVRALTEQAFAESIECYDQTVGLDGSQRGTFVFENDDGNFFLVPVFPVGSFNGAGSIDGFFEFLRTSNRVVYEFPNASIGASVRITLLKVRCGETNDAIS